LTSLLPSDQPPECAEGNSARSPESVIDIEDEGGMMSDRPKKKRKVTGHPLRVEHSRFAEERFERMSSGISNFRVDPQNGKVFFHVLQRESLAR
jgi:hypothetical protein